MEREIKYIDAIKIEIERYSYRTVYINRGKIIFQITMCCTPKVEIYQEQLSFEMIDFIKQEVDKFKETNEIYINTKEKKDRV